MGSFDEDRLPASKRPMPAEASTAGREAAASSHERHILQLQRQAGNAGVAQLLRDENDGAAVQQLISGGGRALDSAVRVQMEAAFGEDFHDVRVHTGGDASASAESLGARAYTVGNDVVFSDGTYDPDSSAGQRTLAHELTHVVQQRSGPVDGEDTGTGVKVSDPHDRFEQAAEANADRVMAGGGSDTAPAGAAGVQREAIEDEDETAQGLWVQREEMGEEELPEEA